MRFLCFLVLFSYASIAFAQFADDFSNGNFTDDPPWVGDHDKFVVDDGRLRLFDDEAGMSWLSTQSHILHNTQWDFWVRLAFTPSDNNHARVYLVSDQADLTLPLNGYFLQIGKTGGDMKRIFFFRQDGAETTLLMTGAMNLADGSNNILRVRVIRDEAGNWSILADPDGGELLLPQGQVFDNTHQATSWFGVRCTYTVSNSRRIYFDDFRVGEIQPGHPPEVIRLQAVSTHMLDVYFSTVLDPETATNTDNYVASPDIGQPVIAAQDPAQPHIVRLQFVSAFEENRLYTIHIANVKSLDGQTMEPFAGTFTLYVPQRFDVVFNEIMANSRPSVSLPPHDWIELYNTTELPVDVEGWVLQHGDTQRLLPHALIEPGGYLVLTTETAYPEMTAYGNVLAVPGLPATAFTIGGTSLSLWDDNGSLVSFVHYSDRWYRDNAKSNGGWSLEKIDPYNYGQGAENWKASGDPRGGTPGETNSVRGENPNTTNPRLVRAGLTDPLTIRLHFSEPMNEDSLACPLQYTIDKEIGSPLSVKTFPPDLTIIDIALEHPLEPGKTYKVSTKESLCDLDGNPIAGTHARVAIPESPQRGAVVINEILFNTFPGGSRYVEIYNRSDRVVDLQEMILASADTLENEITSVRHISEDSFLFFPGDYLVLTNDTAGVTRFYSVPHPDIFAELSGMPRMTNTGGVIVVATKGLFMIDKLVYDEAMHLPLIANPSGVALERLHPDRPSDKAWSWHSAAASAGYGTPGRRNSQYVSPQEQTSRHWEVYPRVFVPDGSGYKDVLNISYSLDEPGYVAHIRVFDRRGRLVRTIAPGTLLATAGAITWDGTTDTGEKASVGVYIIHVEMIHERGKVKQEKLWAVIGADLR